MTRLLLAAALLMSSAAQAFDGPPAYGTDWFKKPIDTPFSGKPPGPTHVPPDNMPVVGMAPAKSCAHADVESTLLPSNPKSIRLNIIGLYGVPVLDAVVGGQPVRMILDTGAGSSSVSQEIADRIMRTSHGHLGDPAKFKLADGRILTLPVIFIDAIKVGSYVVKNVRASISEKGSLLLGFDVIRQIGTSFTINAGREALVFTETNAK